MYEIRKLFTRFLPNNEVRRVNLSKEQNNVSLIIFLVVNFTNSGHLVVYFFNITCTVAKVRLFLSKNLRLFGCDNYRDFIQGSR